MKFNIWEDYKYMDLPDVLSFIVDNRGKTVPTDPEGTHLLIATNCIRNEHLYPSYEKIRTLNEDTYQNWFRAHPQPGDIIFVNKGTPGRVCMVPDPVDFCIAQDMMAFRANPEIVYNKYLFAVLRSSKIQGQISSTTVGDVIPHFKKQHLHEIKIPIPPMDVQKIIGDYYFSFCEKEVLNEKINRNLSDQAQSYFDELFVQNPSEDWPEGTLSDIGTIVAGGTPSKAKVEYYAESGIAWITPKDLSVDKSVFISHGENDISDLGYEKSSATKMPAGTVLFSSRAPIGYIAIAANEVTTNQGFKSVVPNENVGTAYVYFLLKYLLPTIENMASGSTFKEISGSAMKIVPTIIPDDVTLKKFNEFCAPILQQVQKNEQESKRLVELRDSLLPKLMSGELDVSDLDI